MTRKPSSKLPSPSLAFKASGAPFDLASKYGEVDHYTRRGQKVLISSTAALVGWPGGLYAAGVPLPIGLIVGMAFAAGLYALDKGLVAPDPNDGKGQRLKMIARGSTILTGNFLVVHLALTFILGAPINTHLAEKDQTQIDQLHISASYERKIKTLDSKIAELATDASTATSNYKARLADQVAESKRGGCGDLCRRDGVQVDNAATDMRNAVAIRDSQLPKLRVERDKVKAAADADLADRATAIRTSHSIVDRVSAADALMFGDLTTGVGSALLLLFALALDSGPLIEALKTGETNTLRHLRQRKELNDAKLDKLHGAQVAAVGLAVSALEPEILVATTDELRSTLAAATPAVGPEGSAETTGSVSDNSRRRGGIPRPVKIATAAGLMAVAALAFASGAVPVPHVFGGGTQAASTGQGQRPASAAAISPATLASACLTLSQDKPRLNSLGQAVTKLAVNGDASSVTGIAGTLRAGADSMPANMRSVARAAAGHLDAVAAHGLTDRTSARAAAAELTILGKKATSCTLAS